MLDQPHRVLGPQPPRHDPSLACQNCGHGDAALVFNEFDLPFATLEAAAHGRLARDDDDEALFGVSKAILLARFSHRMGPTGPGSLQIGLARMLLRSRIVTGIVVQMPGGGLGMVDNPAHMGGDPSRVVPVALTPSLVQVAPRLGVLGAPEVIARVRRAAPALGFDALYAIGTMCPMGPHPRYGCIDPTNRLADISIGATMESGEQWVIVRNARGRIMLDAVGAMVVARTVRDRGDRAHLVRRKLVQLQRTSGPTLWDAFVTWWQDRVRLRGIETLRAHVELQALATALGDTDQTAPPFVHVIADRYGVHPPQSHPL